jgi:hypothetical protein
MGSSISRICDEMDIEEMEEKNKTRERINKIEKSIEIKTKKKLLKGNTVYSFYEGKIK